MTPAPAPAGPQPDFQHSQPDGGTTQAHALAFYGVSALLMTIYGGLVCPFVDSLPVWQWALVLIAGYATLHALRSFAEPAYVLPDDHGAGRRQFLLDMALTSGLGIAITLFDMAIFGFPLESGLKVLTGTVCFGLFMALDITLERERIIALAMRGPEQNDRIMKDRDAAPPDTYAYDTSVNATGGHDTEDRDTGDRDTSVDEAYAAKRYDENVHVADAGNGDGLDHAAKATFSGATSRTGHTPRRMEPEGGPQPAPPFSSLTRRISLLASVVMACNALIISMVVFKDLLYLQGLPPDDVRRQAVFVALEIVFVCAVILCFTLRVVWSYARNLRLAFNAQTDALESVRNGDLTVQVPEMRRDEFGLIARGTNHMIEGLREKRHIRNLLGKVVDPRIAEHLIRGTARGLALGGSRRDVIIFMSDIRDFTTTTETARPETVVEDLNTYFTACVEIITAHGGMVDKFIGDGMLAVFGLTDHGEGEECTCADNALQAAIAIRDRLPLINARLSSPVAIGIGLHTGQVISGLVGSPDRLEFTVIGDAVNTTARLESLSKSLETSIIISDTLYKALKDSSLRSRMTYAGSHALKGKREPVSVWQLAH
ncbi:adenylate/guanylate cyclase domain-containing protein [Desulfovibrio subterraneus]|uniref:adenylate/guanylate cyclase domain-containing protein n=1 Tax=Desulfovibrio subterraneus TaxID=2718620 RepID=UPI0022B8BE43|nr:adenylate/guanylate cyclase domain-containing protein [Desulfovibrio subterraneus]WBF66464.1 adenylate/guanylate cyclase domain-containing protein [Desulfovibrio subterraneus]